MAKIQTRRSVSFNIGLYNELRAHAMEYGVPMARLVGALVKTFLELGKDAKAEITETAKRASP